MRTKRPMHRAFALVLTLVMLISCFIAVPAVAEESTGTEVTTLWGYNFKSFGALNNATIKSNDTYPNGYFVDKDVFYMDVSETGATELQSSGLFVIGGKTYIRNKTTTGENPNKTFFNLLYGLEEGYNTASSPTYFMEMDFIKAYDGGNGSSGSVGPKSDTASWSYVDENNETVTGEGTLYTDENGASGARVFYFGSGAQTPPLFRLAANGEIYTSDNEGGYAYPLARGEVYYKDSNGNKVCLPANASVTNLNLGYCIKDPAKAYYLETGVTYRIGVKFDVSAVATDGTVTMKATVYVKKSGAANWETCVGTTTYKYYPVGATEKATEANDYILLNDTSYGVKVGGDWKIYTYSCDGTNHLNVVSTPTP